MTVSSQLMNFRKVCLCKNKPFAIACGVLALKLILRVNNPAGKVSNSFVLESSAWVCCSDGGGGGADLS